MKIFNKWFYGERLKRLKENFNQDYLPLARLWRNIVRSLLVMTRFWLVTWSSILKLLPEVSWSPPNTENCLKNTLNWIKKDDLIKVAALKWIPWTLHKKALNLKMNKQNSNKVNSKYICHGVQKNVLCQYQCIDCF